VKPANSMHPTALGAGIFASVALALVVGTSGCATNSATPGPASGAEVERLLRADKAFCALAQKRGAAEAFRTFAAEDAVCFPIGEAPVRGRAAILEWMSSGPKGEMKWTPMTAEVARSGDLGYTWGTYEFRGQGDDGQPLVRHGKYVTVWKKQADGSWRFVLDIGNPGPPPK